MKRIAVLGSGEGTNFSAITEYIRSKQLEIEVIAVSDMPNCGFVKRAQRLDVQVKVIARSLGRKKQEMLLLNFLKHLNPNLIVLAGYMRILPVEIVKAFENRIVNIHPALLPSFKGAHAVEDALKYGVKWTGVTIHYVDEGVDTGPIIAQVPVRVFSKDTPDTLTARIHEAEHRIYPVVIEKLLGGENFEGAFECE